MCLWEPSEAPRDLSKRYAKTYLSPSLSDFFFLHIPTEAFWSFWNPHILLNQLVQHLRLHQLINLNLQLAAGLEEMKEI